MTAVMPNFLIIGAAKSGSTALHFILKQHPQIYMCSQKETYFFSFEGQTIKTNGPGDVMQYDVVNNLDDYQALFAGATDEIAIGEACPVYIYLPGTAERIYQYIPQAKIIAILRHPAERAFSSYMHARRDERETLSFADALTAEPERIQQNWEGLWYYRQAGLYYGQLKSFFDRFPRQQIQVYLYDDLQADASTLLSDICRFLGVDEDFQFESRMRPNASGIVKNRHWQAIVDYFFLQNNPVKWIGQKLMQDRVGLYLYTRMKNANMARLTLDPEMRQELTAYFADDIRQLQDLIDRDLSHWLG